MIFEPVGPTSVPFSLFPRECVGGFMPDNSAGDAISNTPASNADLSTQRPNVPLPDLTQTTVQHQSCPPGVTVRDELLLSRGPTPVKPVQLAFYLRGYNNSISDYLIQGFVHGFSIRYLGSLIAMRSQNLKSAKDNPFDVPPFDPFRVSPLGIIPKKSPGEFRLIHHLSYPAGSSVNDGIPKELATVKYATIDDAIRLIKSLGKGCFLAKTDIKSAFRIIPVSPHDFPLLGMEWQGKFYFDKCLPMGCSSSCNIFETFSTALEWIAMNKLNASAFIPF